MLVLLFSTTVFSQQYIEYRSVQTGYDEHLIISGNVHEDMEVTRVSGGTVKWVSRLSVSCGLAESEYIEDLGLYVMVIVEGAWETTVLMDDLGGIIGYRIRLSMWEASTIEGSICENVE